MILVLVIVLVAALVQGVLGFGGALVAMPLLVALIGVQTAAPAFALLGLLATLLNAFHWRRHITPRDIVRLVIPALIGIPLGVWMLGHLDSALVTRFLGAFLVAYAAYALLGLTVPMLQKRRWAVAIGFASGVLTGAYNTGGPPVVVYASGQQWTPNQFRGNLQTYFLVISVFSVLSHAVAGNLTPTTLQAALIAVPGLLIGQQVGTRLCPYIPADLFQKIVLVFLLLLGVDLLFF